MAMQPKTMKFRGFKAEMILRGEKTASLRLYDDKDLKTGDDLELINWDTGEIFARARISEVIEKPLKKIGKEDLLGHEPFKSKEAMCTALRKYYGDHIGPGTPGKIVRFRLVAAR